MSKETKDQPGKDRGPSTEGPTPEEEDRMAWEREVKFRVGIALEKITFLSTEMDAKCIVCSFQLSSEKGKTVCQKGCPARPLREFMSD